MINQILAQALNGFTLVDLPFLILQLSVSAVLALLIRVFWMKAPVKEDESGLLKYLVPLQITLTLIAVFSIRSPWIIVLFGLVALFPLTGNSNLSFRSRVFYMVVVGVAFGCGIGNLAVTTLVIGIVVLPLLYILK